MSYQQHQIMGYLIGEIKSLIESYFKKNGRIPTNFREDSSSKNKLECNLEFLGFVENRESNMMMKIEVKSGKNGKNESLVKPPLNYNLRMAVVLEGGKPQDRLSALGELMGFLRENYEIDPGDFDWAGNKGANIRLRFYPMIDADKSLLPAEIEKLKAYGIIIESTVGIESSESDSFARVKERRLTALHKKD